MLVVVKWSFNDIVRSCISALLVVELILTMLPYSMAGASFLRDNWMVFNYSHLNEKGFRDGPSATHGINQIVFIGDSFTAGVGITNIEDRFDRVFARSTNGAYTTANLGIFGSGADKQLNALNGHLGKPCAVVYQYYVNDIDATVSVLGLDSLRPIDDKFIAFTRNPVLTFSYVVNTLFWMLPNPWINVDYNSYLEMLWSRKDIVQCHEKELQSIIDYCQVNQMPLFVIVFPDLANLERFNFVSDNVLRYFDDRCITTLDVRELVRCEKRSDTMVNFQDSHPSVKTHELVGIKLAELVETQMMSR